MPQRQDERVAADAAAELAERDNRPGERHGTDQDTEIGLDIMNRQFDPLEMRHAVRVHEIGKTHGDGSHTDQAVQNRDKLWHLCHLHATREDDADRATDQQRDNQHHVMLGDDTDDRREQRDGHACDAVPVAPSRCLLVRESAESKDKENRCSDVRDRNNACGQGE